MLKGTTKSGFAFEIDERLADDFELLEAIADSDKSATAAMKVLKMVFGEEGIKGLKDHVRDEDGFVSAEKMMEELSEVFLLSPALKK